MSSSDLERAERADHEHLRAALERAAGRVRRRLRQRLEHVVEHDAERRHLRRVRLDVDLLDRPPYDTTSATPGTRMQRGPHDPVLDRAQRHRIGAVALERVAIDLADRRRERAEVGLDAVGRFASGDALDDLLARDERIDAVLERQRDERQAEQRDRAQAVQAGHAVERALERDRDPALDLLGRLAGVDRDDLDLGVGRIGERLDRQVRVRVPARARRANTAMMNTRSRV